MAALDVAAFARGDPLYLDSPATILIVAINTVLFVVPSVLLITLFWRQRATLRALLSAPKAGAA